MGYNSPLYIGQVIGDRPTFFLIKKGFFGKQSKDLLKTVDYHDGYTGGSITYQYDSTRRITTIQDGYQFRYQCP
jgi:hypothetical protein